MEELSPVSFNMTYLISLCLSIFARLFIEGIDSIIQPIQLLGYFIRYTFTNQNFENFADIS